MKIRKFEEIDAWKEARELVKLVYKSVNANDNFNTFRDGDDYVTLAVQGA